MDNEKFPQGHIEDVGLLNLLAAKSPEDLKGIVHIEDVGAILIPRSLMPALLSISMEDVGAIIPVPEGEDVVLMNGQTVTTGEALAAGDPERTLVLVGQVFIETPVTKVGYRGIHIHGQLIAPRGSEAALATAVREVSGQVAYIPDKARRFMGSDEIGRGFLEALPRPTSLVVFGSLEFEDDIDTTLLRQMVPEIVLFGKIVAPRGLVPTIQVLTIQKFGEIQAK